MRAGRSFSIVLAGLLIVLAAYSSIEARRFEAAAVRTDAVIVDVVEHKVRALFATELERYPLIEFHTASGATERFEATVQLERLGLTADTAIGTTLPTAVLYDPAAPQRARLGHATSQRASLVLLLAGLGLLGVPWVLERAFKNLGRRG